MDSTARAALTRIASDLVMREKYADHDQDSFNEASEIFIEEARARYDAEAHADGDEYLEGARSIFEVEWNDDGSDGDDDVAGEPESAATC
ncbi:MAG: hypothetical protein ACLPTZ_15065 [Beijerinckiaceae bacterium]